MYLDIQLYKVSLDRADDDEFDTLGSAIMKIFAPRFSMNFCDKGVTLNIL